MIVRCINIDWLEVYAHEMLDGQPRDAEYFRTLGFSVLERDYGTRIYEQMFTILDNHGEAWIEVRRLPKGLNTVTNFSVLDEGSCHLRLCNRTCYFPHAAQIMIDFCDRYGFIVSRISRLDICLDFEKFDSGDNPQDFLYRYLKGRYSKINQANIHAHGKDMWDGRAWNSLSWGAHKSMIGTKFYNKTLELTEVHDKPYIRQAWLVAGLIDNFTEMTRHRPDGSVYKPDIWRLEFSIKSSVKKWFVIEDLSGKKKQLRSIHHTLQDYTTPELLFEHFRGLTEHYFHFKYFEQGQRKDRCKDKVLFIWEEMPRYYKVDSVAAAKPVINPLERLRRRLEEYIMTHSDKSAITAAKSLLEAVKSEILRKQAGSEDTRQEILILQQLISRRIHGDDGHTLDEDIRNIESYMNLEQELFT